MGNWIVVKKEELELLMIIMGKERLNEVTAINENYSPSESIIDNIVKKGFFEDADGGRQMNSFVHFVMWNVFNADCVLYTWKPDSSICYIYFKSDVMILLTKDADSENYVFYFVPYIPQAIGGFSYCLKALTDRLTGENSEEINEIIADSEIKQIDDILDSLRERSKDEAEGGTLELTLRGDVFDEPVIFGALINQSDKWLFAQAEDRVITYSSVDGYGMLKKISEWIIATHGSCINWGMKNE